jgi:hypothetical protein
MYSMKMRWLGHIAPMTEMRNVYKFFVGKPQGRGSLATPRLRWKDNIKIGY